MCDLLSISRRGGLKTRPYIRCVKLGELGVPDVLVPGVAPLFEQARGVARDRAERGCPSERAGAGAANDLIERQHVGVAAHLRARLVERHMPETTHLARAPWPGAAEHPGMAALKRAVAQAWPDDEEPPF